MSLRAKCLPQKSSLQLSATKQTNTTTVKTKNSSSASKHRFAGVATTKSITKELKIVGPKNQPATSKHLATNRNARAIHKCSAVSAAVPKTSKGAQPIKSSSSGKECNNKNTQTRGSEQKQPEKLDDKTSPSSIHCSRSGRRLVPARCACANDSVTARCSIHNNNNSYQQQNSLPPSSKSPQEFKVPQNLSQVSRRHRLQGLPPR